MCETEKIEKEIAIKEVHEKITALEEEAIDKLNEINALMDEMLDKIESRC